jgi:hypothetical protein
LEGKDNTTLPEGRSCVLFLKTRNSGEPDAGKPHVRFDEERLRREKSQISLLLYAIIQNVQVPIYFYFILGRREDSLLELLETGITALEQYDGKNKKDKNITLVQLRWLRENARNEERLPSVVKLSEEQINSLPEKIKLGIIRIAWYYFDVILPDEIILKLNQFTSWKGIVFTEPCYWLLDYLVEGEIEGEDAKVTIPDIIDSQLKVSADLVKKNKLYFNFSKEEKEINKKLSEFAKLLGSSTHREKMSGQEVKEILRQWKEYFPRSPEVRRYKLYQEIIKQAAREIIPLLITLPQQAFKST